jgi:hypothetical protein
MGMALVECDDVVEGDKRNVISGIGLQLNGLNFSGVG